MRWKQPSTHTHTLLQTCSDATIFFPSRFRVCSPTTAACMRAVYGLHAIKCFNYECSMCNWKFAYNFMWTETAFSFSHIKLKFSLISSHWEQNIRVLPHSCFVFFIIIIFLQLHRFFFSAFKLSSFLLLLILTAMRIVNTDCLTRFILFSILVCSRLFSGFFFMNRTWM